MKRQIVCVSVLFAFGVGRVTTAGQVAAAVPQDHVEHVADQGPPLTLKAALEEALSKNLDLAALRRGSSHRSAGAERALARQCSKAPSGVAGHLHQSGEQTHIRDQ